MSRTEERLKERGGGQQDSLDGELRPNPRRSRLQGREKWVALVLLAPSAIGFLFF
ncbi:MAG: hypothetical protein FWD83_03620 [Promicromonosporaceae bacterium]|nr:hypothetical protein [Promicromonosporaceae bacterium]